MNSTSADLFAMAELLDARGQYDLADRMERLAATFDPDDIGGEMFGGFDPEAPPFRGNPQSRLNWWPSPRDSRRMGIPRRILPGGTEERPTQGVRPWPLAEDAAGDLKAREWETYHSPSGSMNDPRGEYQSHPPLDEGEIMGRIMTGIMADFPEFEGMDDDEVISRLIHAQYAELKFGGDDQQAAEFTRMVESGQPIDYDPAVLEQAKQDVGRWIAKKFEDTEREMQENWSE